MFNMFPKPLVVLVVAFAVVVLANDLIPNCPDPSDGSNLMSNVEGITTALSKAGQLLPEVGQIFKFITAFLGGLFKILPKSKSTIIDQMKAYIKCELALVEEQIYSTQMADSLNSYKNSLQAIAIGRPTQAEYISQFYQFFTLIFQSGDFIDPGKLQSNVEYFRHAVSLHLGAGLELLTAGVKFNSTRCLEYRDKWNYFYANKYMPYARTLISKAVAWRLSYVKLRADDSCRYVPCFEHWCPPDPGSRDEWIEDAFVSSAKIAKVSDVCDGSDPQIYNSLLKNFNDYKSAIQTRMEKNFALPLSHWDAWSNKINKACPNSISNGQMVWPKNWDNDKDGLKRQLVCKKGFVASTVNVTCNWPHWNPTPACIRKH